MNWSDLTVRNDSLEDVFVKLVGSRMTRKGRRPRRTRWAPSKRIRADLVNFGRSYTRSRIGLFFGLAFPVILILLFGAIFSGSGSARYSLRPEPGQRARRAPIPPGAQRDGRPAGNARPASQNFSQYLLSHSASDGIVIPPNFSADYAAGIPVNVTEYWNPSSSTSQGVFGITSGVLNAFNLHRANGTPVLGVQTTHDSVVTRTRTSTSSSQG